MNDPIKPPNVEENCPYVAPDCKDDSFKTNDQSNLNVARKDKFKIVIDVPQMLKPFLQKEDRYCNGGNLDRLQFSIWGYVVPDVVANVLDVPYSGQTMKFSGLSRPPWPDVTVNFTVDNRYDNYFILWKWIDIQNDEETSTFDGKNLSPCSKAHLRDYSTIFSVFSIDEYDKPVARWNYFGAFPNKIAGLNAEYRNTDPNELESSFTFVYSKMNMQLI